MVLSSRGGGPMVDISRNAFFQAREGSSHIEANSPIVVNTAMLPMKEKR